MLTLSYGQGKLCFVTNIEFRAIPAKFTECILVYCHFSEEKDIFCLGYLIYILKSKKFYLVLHLLCNNLVHVQLLFKVPLIMIFLCISSFALQDKDFKLDLNGNFWIVIPCPFSPLYWIAIFIESHRYAFNN